MEYVKEANMKAKEKKKIIKQNGGTVDESSKGLSE